MKSLYEIIKEEVMDNIISKANSSSGDDLTKVTMNIMDIKEILYSTLLDMELKSVNDRWGR